MPPERYAEGDTENSAEDEQTNKQAEFAVRHLSCTAPRGKAMRGVTFLYPDDGDTTSWLKRNAKRSKSNRRRGTTPHGAIEHSRSCHVTA